MLQSIPEITERLHLNVKRLTQNKGLRRVKPRSESKIRDFVTKVGILGSGGSCSGQQLPTVKIIHYHTHTSICLRDVDDFDTLRCDVLEIKR